MRKKPYTLRFHTNTYHYLGNHPKERSHKWAENAQGVTHDGDHWYLSNDKKLFKYHIETDINSNDTRATTGMPSNLSSEGYEKFKALAYHGGFLFVPIVGEHAPAAIAMFRPGDLGYVSHTVIPEALKIGNPGWVAIHPKEGRLYTSTNQLNYEKGLKVFDFAINDDQSGFSMVFSHQLFPRLGMKLTHMQGGAFSPEGQLYIINGYYDTDVRKGGISVFGLHDFHFQQKSDQVGEFRFEWDTAWNVSQEPEGLTFWDLDEDDRAPNISGQLHALLLDNDWPDDDDVYMKHYRMSDPIPAVIPPLSLRHAFLGDETISTGSPASLRGITHDHKHRFIATKTTLSKKPILPDNPDHLTSVMVSWPDTLGNYSEIGDICYLDGHILVPFSEAGRTPTVAVFDTETLTLQARIDLAQSGKIACLGVDAVTREHLHAIDAQGNGQKYRIEGSPGHWDLVPQGNRYRFFDADSPQPVETVTGGEISAVSGFFYLVHDGEISVFHSNGTLVDTSAFEHETFGMAEDGWQATQLTVDCWHEPFPPGMDFDNIADVTALTRDSSSSTAALRSWEIDRIQLIGNKRSKELHLQGCSFQKRMALPNQVPFLSLESALSSGYNGCHYCLKSYDNG